MPSYKSLKRFRLFKRTLQLYRELKLKYKIRKNKIKVVIGSGGSCFNGWISTDKDIFDITELSEWEKYFKNKEIDNILAEHVFEHLSINDIKKTFLYIYEYLRNGGILRFAVPDGYHPSSYVRELTKPGGLEPGADTHKIFFNIDIVEKLAKEVCFKLNKIEYFDKNGFFHKKDFTFENGYISRCSKNYKGRFTNNDKEYSKFFNSIPEHLQQQFIDNKISYTSLLVDFIK